LEGQALTEMERMLGTGDQLFTDTLDVEQILEENYTPPLGQPSRKVNLTMQVEFAASYASNDDLTELADIVLNASKPEGYVARDKSISFETVDAPRTNSEGLTRWVVSVSRELEKDVDTGVIIPLVQGRSLANARTKLKDNLNLPNTPKIQLSPEWWPWLPLIPFNITLET
jgi:hypothetical protein